MKRIRTIIAYLIVISFILYFRPMNHELLDLGVAGCYVNTFNYLHVGGSLAIIFLYLLMNRLECVTDAGFIVRIPKKQTILWLELIETISLSVQFTFFTSLVYCIMVGIIQKNFIFSMEMYIYLIWTMLAQIAGWTFIGLIFVFALNILNKSIVSIVVSELAVIIMFFSQSQTFSLRRFFYNIYESMILDALNGNVNDYIKKIITNVILSVVLFILCKFTYVRKGLYGGSTVDENN